MKLAFSRPCARLLQHWQAQLSLGAMQPSLLMILANAWLAYEGLCAPEPMLTGTRK